MVVEYTAKGDSFSAEKPRLWSERRIFNNGFSPGDLAPDGKRFAVLLGGGTATEDKGSLHATFLLNYFDELRRKAPAK